MKHKNKYPSVNNLISKQLNLSDFGFKKQIKKYFKNHGKEYNTDIEFNEFSKFIEMSYNYSIISLDKYSSHFSKHTYSQYALFTIIALKIYLNTTYRKITI